MAHTLQKLLSQSKFHLCQSTQDHEMTCLEERLSQENSWQGSLIAAKIDNMGKLMGTQKFPDRHPDFWILIKINVHSYASATYFSSLPFHSGLMPCDKNSMYIHFRKNVLPCCFYCAFTEAVTVYLMEWKYIKNAYIFFQTIKASTDHVLFLLEY